MRRIDHPVHVVEPLTNCRRRRDEIDQHDPTTRAADAHHLRRRHAAGRRSDATSFGRTRHRTTRRRTAATRRSPPGATRCRSRWPRVVARPAAGSDGVRSTPTTCRTCGATGSAACAAPHATSSTIMSSRSGSIHASVPDRPRGERRVGPGEQRHLALERPPHHIGVTASFHGTDSARRLGGCGRRADRRGFGT